MFNIVDVSQVETHHYLSIITSVEISQECYGSFLAAGSLRKKRMLDCLDIYPTSEFTAIDYIKFALIYETLQMRQMTNR